MIRPDPLTKRPIHKPINLLPGFGSEVIPPRIFLEIEFRPYHQMDDIRVNPVRPVVVQDFDIVFGPSVVSPQPFHLIMHALNEHRPG